MVFVRKELRMISGPTKERDVHGESKQTMN
jgi:hypothetical protein